MIILSILTPSIPSRFDKWLLMSQNLYLQIANLHETHPTLGRVQHISDTSDSFLNGGMSIGKKRQKLIEFAKGKYLCFLDDDEDISPNYVETLVRLCQENKDCCTFKAIAKTDSFWGVIDMSLYNPDTEANPRSDILRNVWHVCPIRSDIAKAYSFPDSNYGEDIIWLSDVRKEIKSEAHSPYILLQYNHSSKTSEADKIMNNG